MTKSTGLTATTDAMVNEMLTGKPAPKLNNMQAAAAAARAKKAAKAAQAALDAAPINAEAVAKVITKAARKAKGKSKITKAAEASKAARKAAKAKAKPKAPTQRKGTKQAKVIEMLKSDKGATYAEIAKAMEWLPHTTRAMVSVAIEKKLGLKVTRETDEKRGMVMRIK